LGNLSLAGFIQYRLGLIGTTTAIRGDTEMLPELIQVIDAVLCSSADLLVGYSVANADVHKFNNLARFQVFNCK
jgi:hypothetical protein